MPRQGEQYVTQIFQIGEAANVREYIPWREVVKFEISSKTVPAIRSFVA